MGCSSHLLMPDLKLAFSKERHYTTLAKLCIQGRTCSGCNVVHYVDFRSHCVSFGFLLILLATVPLMAFHSY